jgi:DNA-binding Lrp family transcriptional regulator
MDFNDIDLRIMRATQAGLPLVSEPYQQLSAELNLPVDVIMARLRAMQQNGVIRRIGAVPNHYRLGYRFNGMSVWNVPDEEIDTLGEQVGKLPFVSHCYHRPRHLPYWHYNLFAMVHGRTQEEVNEQIKQIAEVLGESNRGNDVLYSTQILKKTGFRSGNKA